MLFLDRLEPRLAPAHVVLSHRTLFISQQVGPLAVEVNNDVVAVLDLGPVQGFPQCKVDRVKITDTPGDDIVQLFANDGVAKYDVLFCGSTGNDTVYLEGHYKGDVTYKGGSGNNALIGVSTPVRIDGDLTFVSGTAENLVTLQQINFVIKGNLTVNASQSARTALILADYTDPSYTNRVKGKLTYIGGAGTDEVTFFTGFGDHLKFGKVKINLGTSSNSFFPDDFNDDAGVCYRCIHVTPNMPINGHVRH